MILTDEEWELLSILPKREKDIICQRLVGETLEELGKKYNLSRERIRQIETKVLENIRNSIRLNHLKLKGRI